MKDTKQIRRDFHSVTWVMPRAGTLGRCGAQGVNFFVVVKHGHVAYQIDRDDKQNRIQEKNLSYGQTIDIGVRSKAQILNFSYHVNLKDFYTRLCVCSHK